MSGDRADDAERRARMLISCATDGGDPAIAELIEIAGAEATWQAMSEGALGLGIQGRARNADLDQLLAKAEQFDIRFVVPGDDEWPGQLRALEHCSPIQRRGGVPAGLWLRGRADLAKATERSVAIVGARASTSYGDGIATDLAAGLADKDYTVVSGGAFGIDTAAHRGALAVHGSTIAVLACGVDVPYPRGNAAMFEWLAQHQLLVSELAPGATPTRLRFLARNRIIAGLAAGTVVVEAGVRSGARNSASWTLACGRHLMAVPGPVHSALSVGPHVLIQNQQAILVTETADVLELLAPVGTELAPIKQGVRRPTDGLDPQRLAVYESLHMRGFRSVAEVAVGAGVSVPDCLAELAALEAAGLAEGTEHGWRIGR